MGTLHTKKLLSLKELIIKNKNIVKNEYNFNLIIKIVENFTKSFKTIRIQNLKTEYKKILILLPKNIPVIPLQLFPLRIAYGDSEFFFKLPKKRFKTEELIINHLYGKDRVLKGLTHKKLSSIVKNFDFIIAFGSLNLFSALNLWGKPFKFFGPKFSVGYIENLNEPSTSERIAEDFLSFDTEGCLSLRLLFVKKLNEEILKKSLIKKAKEIPPQKYFNKELFYYYSNVLMIKERGKIFKNFSYFLTSSFPEYFPQRTLFIVKIERKNDLVDFLSDKINSVQGFLYDSEEDYNFFKDKFKNSIFLKFGNSQFPETGWFFDKRSSLENFFNIEG